ncbi:membrane dipeptidase [Rhizobium sp. CCGE531]|uniref:membrane dipeptidase n=1 Tax=Rhizobium sp. CCGE531 TaxID=2364271 RepID=UPI000EA89725|nr:membrane dipeptidase [Rhizobium sp. CCGE531]AYG70648.1 peptidase M19 [Rhizobium sp. CCGE531]
MRSIRDDAVEIIRSSFVFDCLSLNYVLDKPYAEACLDAGVNATNVTFAAEQDWESTLRSFETFLRKIEANPLLHLALNSSDIERAAKDGKLAVMPGTQGASMIDDQLWRVSLLFRLGLRFIGLTYSQSNKLGSGCGELNDAGLSFLGKDFIAAVNELPMFLDLSHTGHQSRRQAIELATNPTFTHANAFSVTPNDRNVKDDELSAVVAKGGMIGLCCVTRTVRKTQATVSDLIDHADHITSHFGFSSCGLGLDYSDGLIASKTQPPESIRWRSLRPDIWGTNDDFFNLKYPQGVETIAGLCNITATLIDRGYSRDEIEAILGGNWLRSIRRVVG